MFTILTPSEHLFTTSLAEAENRPKSAHRYNVAEQQQIYKSEIERIWKAQFDSLSRKDEPELLPEDEEQPEIKPPLPLQRQSSVRKESVAPYSAMSPPVAAAPSPAFSRGSSVDRDREMSLGPDNGRRVLRIKRLVGLSPASVESVTDLDVTDRR